MNTNEILRGKTAVVTGGARGIGAAICKQLAAMGADIAVCARKADERRRKIIIVNLMRFYGLDNLFVIQPFAGHCPNVYAGSMAAYRPVGTGVNRSLIDNRVPFLRRIVLTSAISLREYVVNICLFVDVRCNIHTVARHEVQW